jgi:hypothetical protein
VLAYTLALFHEAKQSKHLLPQLVAAFFRLLL